MAMTRIYFRDKLLNTRTRDMILAAEKLLGYKLTIIQGSYNTGVTASAGTHDGGGAVDVWGKSLDDATRVTNTMRRVGFAAWHRTPAQGNWGHHIHAVAVGDPELSRGAAAQVADYKAGRNGLASDGPDTFTRAYVGVTWESYAKKLAQPILHAWSINYATTGKGMSGQTLAEAKRFVAFAQALKAISAVAQTTWLDYVAKGEWAKAAKLFTQILKSVQAVGHLHIDGVFGRETGGFVDNYGYNIIY
jgi:hypothetical protein